MSFYHIHRSYARCFSIIILFQTYGWSCSFQLSTPSSYSHVIYPTNYCHRQRFRTCSFTLNGIREGNEDENNDGDKNAHDLEDGDDIAKRLSVSRNRAISALSQPSSKSKAISSLSQRKDGEQPDSASSSNFIAPLADCVEGTLDDATTKSDDMKKPERKTYLNGSRSSNTFNINSKRKNRRRPPKWKQQKQQQQDQSSDSISPVIPQSVNSKKSKQNYSDDEDLFASGLSSWEEFLGFKRGMPESSNSQLSRSNVSSSLKEGSDNALNQGAVDGNNGSSKPILQDLEMSSRLPSVSDLFPPDPISLNTSKLNDKSTSMISSNRTSSSVPSKQQQQSLDGVLPVSDLFYRSAQSIYAVKENLPSPSEQSDEMSADNKKSKISRIQAAGSHNFPSAAAIRSFSGSSAADRRGMKTSSDKSNAPPGRKRMVRRGMEMLVGGVPINADPPQRSIELLYEDSSDWEKSILLNSKDFGPLLDANSITCITERERGLFCEHFVHQALKWDVCPKDLKSIVENYYQHGPLQQQSIATPEKNIQKEQNEQQASSTQNQEQTLETTKPNGKRNMSDMNHKNSAEERGFGKKFTSGSIRKEKRKLRLGGALKFAIGVCREDLESGADCAEGDVLKDVLIRGISVAIERELNGFHIKISDISLEELDDGMTSIDCEFILIPEAFFTRKEMQEKAQSVNRALLQAMENGAIQLAMASSAKNENRWDENVRNQVVEEFLFEDDDDEEEDQETEDNLPKDQRGRSRNDTITSTTLPDANGKGNIKPKIINEGPPKDLADVKFSTDSTSEYNVNNGAFYDHHIFDPRYSPYSGDLGPILLDAAVERARQRSPRVIAIGDVHGCIDELQDLLRKCDYQPGDLVVFLGDLVSKGPDSLSVVQMAREIGAIGVRGNHDFEVVRWHQAIKSGVDPPVVGSEHFHVASCLGKEDMEWLSNLPWYISSKQLGTLFVHAGFVSGIRLMKQNPRLMMNMRSILPDGTVTSKFFNNWPWARLWDGPQTVLFGHDADRGLQQYEHAIGLDTGCVYGGRLTACILPEKRLVSVSARREYFKYRRKHYD